MPNEFFINVCDAIQKNDPRFTELKISSKISLQQLNNYTEALHHNTVVTDVELSYTIFTNKVTEVDIASAFAKLLLKNSTITHLNLAANWFCAESILILTEALKKNQSVRILYLDQNQLNKEATTHLSQFLMNKNCRLTGIDLSESLTTTESIISIINAVEKNNSLHYLAIDKNEIDKEAALAIASLLRKTKTLQRLSLKSCKLGEENAKVLSEGLKENESLSLLDITDNNISDNGFAAFVNAIKNNNTNKLSTLFLGENNLTDACVKDMDLLFEHLINLKELDCYNNDFSDQFTECLTTHFEKKIPLEKLNIGYNSLLSIEKIEKLLKSIESHTRLKTLKMSNYNITTDIADQFAAMIVTNSSIIELDMSNCEFHSGSLKKITEALLKNSKIQSLNLSRNFLANEIPEEDLKFLLQLQSLKPNLKLDLDGQEIAKASNSVVDSNKKRKSEAEQPINKHRKNY